MEEEFSISNTDYWFKVVALLQHSWGVIEETESGCNVYFFGDTAGVFDKIDFRSVQEAEEALRRNGFTRFEENKKAKEFIAKPKPPFRKQPHPNGPIYSSGRYWR